MLPSILLTGLVMSFNSLHPSAQDAPQTRIVAEECSVSRFSYTYLYAAGAIRFKDESTSELRAIVKWSWNFGDGKSSTLQNPEHFFSSEGTYNVTLTVTDDQGCSNEITQTVTWKYP